MRRIMVIAVLGLTLISSYAAVKYVLLKCDADTYTTSLSPDTNFGGATNIDALMKFSYAGNTYTNLEFRHGFLHYVIPENLIGKVTVTEAGANFYVDSFKGKSPYKPGVGIFYAALQPILAPWDELAVTYRTEPRSSAPSYIEADSSKGTYNPKVGWNKFMIVHNGIIILQAIMNSGEKNYGLCLVTDVSGPSGETLAQGDYLSQLQISSKETKRASYLVVGYELKTGMILNNTTINTASVGELKATYH